MTQEDLSCADSSKRWETESIEEGPEFVEHSYDQAIPWQTRNTYAHAMRVMITPCILLSAYEKRLSA